MSSALGPPEFHAAGTNPATSSKESATDPFDVNIIVVCGRQMLKERKGPYTERAEKSIIKHNSRGLQSVGKLIIRNMTDLGFESLKCRYLRFNWRVSNCTKYYMVD